MSHDHPLFPSLFLCLCQVEEDSASLRVELKQKELALQQAKTKTEEQLKRQTEQLTQAELRHGSAESKMADLQSKIDALQQELIVVRGGGGWRERWRGRREG